MKTDTLGVNEKSQSELSAANDEIAKLKATLLFYHNELLQFSHVASHDLQEPLRKIQIYAGILKDRDTVNNPDREIVEKILKSSNRMSLLVSDILAHSKVAGSEKMLRPVDLNEVATKVINDFELLIAERQANISVDYLPTVNAFSLEMNQLFYNLVDNALKFYDSSRTPQISIRFKKLDKTAVTDYFPIAKEGTVYYDITISDNGIGFDAMYAEQIFRAFKRLHPKDVYPGSGIGLSLCRNIMANHQGTLFVESEPGEGSAFHIIIPA